MADSEIDDLVVGPVHRQDSGVVMKGTGPVDQRRNVAL